MKNLFVFTFLLAFTGCLFGQNSAYILFKKREARLSESIGCPVAKMQDSTYFETVLKIGDGQYFYIKQRTEDTLTVECGQLKLYNISGKDYLLREGEWLLEDSTEKVVFQNLGKRNLLEEIRIHFEPFEYEGFKPEKTKRIRSKKTKRTSSPVLVSLRPKVNI